MMHPRETVSWESECGSTTSGAAMATSTTMWSHLRNRLKIASNPSSTKSSQPPTLMQVTKLPLSLEIFPVYSFQCRRVKLSETEKQYNFWGGTSCPCRIAQYWQYVFHEQYFAACCLDVILDWLHAEQLLGRETSKTDSIDLIIPRVANESAVISWFACDTSRSEESSLQDRDLILRLWTARRLGIHALSYR